jgi:hypothetical protein
LQVVAVVVRVLALLVSVGEEVEQVGIVLLYQESPVEVGLVLSQYFRQT